MPRRRSTPPAPPYGLAARLTMGRGSITAAGARTGLVPGDMPSHTRGQEHHAYALEAHVHEQSTSRKALGRSRSTAPRPGSHRPGPARPAPPYGPAPRLTLGRGNIAAAEHAPGPGARGLPCLARGQSAGLRPRSARP
jgi:hypothetical protein